MYGSLMVRIPIFMNLGKVQSCKVFKLHSGHQAIQRPLKLYEIAFAFDSFFLTIYSMYSIEKDPENSSQLLSYFQFTCHLADMILWSKYLFHF